MDWFQNHWIWFAVAVGFISMTFSGHGGHGSHGRGRDNHEPNPGDRNSTPAADQQARGDSAGHDVHQPSPATAPSKQHRRGCSPWALPQQRLQTQE